MALKSRVGAEGLDIGDTVSTSDERPKLSAGLTEELQLSVRSFEQSMLHMRLGSSEEQTGELEVRVRTIEELPIRTTQMNALEPTRDRPTSSTSLQEGMLEDSVQQMTTPHNRSLLHENAAEDLGSSSPHFDSVGLSRRQQVKARQLERKYTQHQVETLSSDIGIAKEEMSFSGASTASYGDKPKRDQSIPYQVPEVGQRMPPELFEELRQRVHDKVIGAFERRQRIKERVMKRRQSQKKFGETAYSFPSCAEESDDGTSYVPPSSPTQTTIQKSYREFNHGFGSPSKESASGPQTGGDDSKFPGGSKSETAEWAKLLREKNKSDKKVAELSQEVDDLRSKSKDLRNQLAAWQEKVSSISKSQTQDHEKFQNSADLITKARVEVTNTLNENSMLKGKLHENYLSSEDRDRKISALNETIDLQANKITSLTREMRDTDVELRHYANEKRRLEEEVAVLMSSRDSKSIGSLMQELEQSRVGWLEEKEHALETKRLALDAENSRILERDKRQHRNEAKQLMEVAERTRERERELDRVQADISQHVEDLRQANQELRAQLTEENAENRKEMKRKDHMIIVIEKEVSKLRRKLAVSQLREQENDALLAEIKNNSEELRKAVERNLVLEKRIRKLKKQMKKKNDAGDWREIVLPGYQHLRGVTFGAPSDELAGFLTILVEDQKARKADSLTELQKEIRRYLKEPSDERNGGTKDSRTTKKKSLSKMPAKLKPKLKAKKKAMELPPKTKPKAKPKKKKIDVESLDQSDRHTAQLSKKTKSLTKLTRDLERDLDFLDEESSFSSLQQRKKLRQTRRHTKRTIRDDDDSSTTVRRHKRRKPQAKKQSKRQDQYLSDDSSYSYYRPTTQSWDRKRHRGRHEKAERAEGGVRKTKQRPAQSRRVSRYPTLDEKLEMLAQLEKRSSGLSKIPDPDDISLVVMKQNHHERKPTKSSKNTHRGDSRRSGGILPFVPPPIIALQ